MNRNSFRTERKPLRASRAYSRWWAAPGAFLATMLALPVSAGVNIPADPLASGVRVAPNILFILDDSGSMAWVNINNASISSITGSGNFSSEPDWVACDRNGRNCSRADGITQGTNITTETTDNSAMYMQNYVTNTLYYNPAIDYQPWMDANGNRLTGGTSYNSAYSDTNYVTYPAVEGSGTATSGGTKNLSSNTQTFYVPKSPSSTDNNYLSKVENYYRFQIPSGGADVVRSTWGDVVETSVAAPGFPKSGVSANQGNWVKYTVNVPAGTSTLTVKSSGGSGDADLYVRYNAEPTTNQYNCRPYLSGNNEKCSFSPPSAGTYYINLYAYSKFSGVTVTVTLATTNRCGTGTGSKDWVDCTSNRPDIPNPSGGGTTQRSVEAEKANFATWYSYYRTRIKTAKGGAAEAFNTQGNKVRVGYRSLHENGSNNFNIPVTDGNDGRFVNNDGTNGNPVTTSRSKWFSRLFRASANSGTPLQSVLDEAGQYFSTTDVSGSVDRGAYGPEKGTAQLSCRQNFTVLTTDGYWNGGTVSTGTKGDGDNGDVITNGLAANDPNYKVYQYKKPAPYKDGNTNTLADVAMRYWKTDLRTDLDNNVPSDYSKVAAENDQIGRDPAFWQHMVTFTISIGLKTSSGLSSVSDVTTATTWAAPGNDDPDNVDDLLHAAVNGRGTFVSAASPQAFADGLAAALAKIGERTASFSNAGASDSTQLNSGTMIFTASYVAGRWTGLLRAERAVGGAEVWKTTNTSIFPAYGSRKVFTRSGTLTNGVGTNGVGGGATFPTSAQTTALTRTGGPANYEVTGANNALYIKGDTSRAGSGPGQLRMRNTLLGDIVNSSPSYVPDSNTVFIGANDGMLHAFNASNGRELFAYIPNIINFGNLADLSRGDYEHRWFVDGPIAITPLAMSPDGNKNILVGTLGRGGKGVYALDVTNPASFSASDVKWERSSTSTTAASDNMGMVLGAPVLAKVRNGSTPTPAVVLGNGVNSSSGKAVLLVLNMTDGSVIKEIATDSTTDNGLFAPTGIYAADGKTLVYVYAGDLQGNVWKFDLTSTTPSAWSAKKIFHAEKTAGAPQPITGGIASAVDSRTNKRWVFFGTGSYLTAADGNDTDTNKQSMYGVIDDITTGSAYTRSNLTARTVTGDGAGERYFQPLTSTMMGGSRGWYVDLPDKGERIVQNAQMDGSFLVTASMMPSGNSCSDASGSGYINAITPFPDMIANGKSYFDLDGDGNTDDTGTSGKPTGSVKTSGMPTLPLLLPGQLRYQTSSGNGEQLIKGKPQWNRVSWRELRND